MRKLQIIRDNRDVMDQLARYLYDHETITGKEFMKIFREAKGIPEPVDTSLFSTSEKVAESVTFNDDGSYSSTVSGEPKAIYGRILQSMMIQIVMHLMIQLKMMSNKRAYRFDMPFYLLLMIYVSEILMKYCRLTEKQHRQHL